MISDEEETNQEEEEEEEGQQVEGNLSTTTFSDVISITLLQIFILWSKFLSSPNVHPTKVESKKATAVIGDIERRQRPTNDEMEVDPW